MSDEEVPDFVDKDPQDEEYHQEEDDSGDEDVMESDDDGDRDAEVEAPEDDNSGDYDEEEETRTKKSEEVKEEAAPAENQPVKRRRGRPPGSGRKKPPKTGRFQALQIPLDEHGNPYTVEDDELLLPEDPAGEEKIDKMGFLKGDRDFRLRTFTILGRGQRQYMLATEPARCIGFRDSYLLFQRHRKLLKIKLTDDEKFDLIDREIIPHSYKGRTLGVVTARSVFREFGARVVVGGRYVRDDYFEEESKAQGHTPNALADPDDYVPPEGQEYDKNQYCAWYNAPAQVDSAAMYENNLKSVLQKQIKGGDIGPINNDYDAIESEALLPDPELVRSSTKSASTYNTYLRNERKQILDRSLAGGSATIDPHTSVRFVPQLLQPTKSRIAKVSHRAPRGAVMVSTVLRLKPNATHLGSLDPSIWETADEATKQAIERQIAREQQG